MNLFSIYLRRWENKKGGSVKVRPINQISSLIGRHDNNARVSRSRREEKYNNPQKIREYGNKSINGKCGTTAIKGVVFASREFRLGCSAAQEDDVRGRKRGAKMAAGLSRSLFYVMYI